MVWSYCNPVRIEFGADSFDKLPALIGKRAYALVTYGEPFFDELERRLRSATLPPIRTTACSPSSPRALPGLPVSPR